jgi:hypothetical protein
MLHIGGGNVAKITPAIKGGVAEKRNGSIDRVLNVGRR